MKAFKKLCIVLLLLFAVGWLASCDGKAEDLGGVPVTPEMLESVSRSLAEKQETDPNTERISDAQTKKDLDPDDACASTASTETVLPEIVYWTESGTVYHLSKTCGTLRRSASILQGSVEEALEAKKERACKTCS